jgi:hypothetical protein
MGTGREEGWANLVGLAAVANAGHRDQSGRIINLVEHAPIADAEAPGGWVMIAEQEATGRARHSDQSVYHLRDTRGDI